MAGTLYLIPVPLGPTPPQDSLPPSVLSTVRPLTHFVVEQAKTARAFLKAAGTDKPLQELQLEELNEHTAPMYWIACSPRYGPVMTLASFPKRVALP
jgi:16S rRNA (cytidine1402-2'-O)-methyltransferase